MAPKLFRIKPQADENAPEDNTLVIINREQAQKHGIELDEVSFPTLESLEEYHKTHNPHLFNNEDADQNVEE